MKPTTTTPAPTEKKKVTTMSLKQPAHRRGPLLLIVVIIALLVLGITYYFLLRTDKSQAKNTANEFMSAILSDSLDATTSLPSSDQALIKNYYTGLQQQLSGSYNLENSWINDDTHFFRYTLSGSSSTHAELAVKNDSGWKVIDFITGGEDASLNFMYASTAVNEEILETRKTAGYQCLEQKDYALSNFNQSEQDAIVWSASYEPDSTLANKSLTIFYKNGSIEPEETADIYSPWGRFAIDTFNKQWNFRIRPILLESSQGTVRESQDTYLAYRRAVAIKDKLIEKGTPEDRIIIDAPRIDLTEFNEENEPITRRVDVVIDPTCR